MQPNAAPQVLRPGVGQRKAKAQAAIQQEVDDVAGTVRKGECPRAQDDVERLGYAVAVSERQVHQQATEDEFLHDGGEDDGRQRHRQLVALQHALNGRLVLRLVDDVVANEQ